MGGISTLNAAPVVQNRHVVSREVPNQIVIVQDHSLKAAQCLGSEDETPSQPDVYDFLFRASPGQSDWPHSTSRNLPHQPVKESSRTSEVGLAAHSLSHLIIFWPVWYS